MSKLHIVCKPNGETRFLYKKGAEIFHEAFAASCNRIERISHVETLIVNDQSIGWYVDLSPIGGKALFPFNSYDDAVAKEVEIIDEIHSKGITSLEDYDSPIINAEILSGKKYNILSEIYNEMSLELAQ